MISSPKWWHGRCVAGVLWLWAALAGPWALRAADDAAFTLAKSGVAQCTLVVPDEATPVELHAAKELCDHVRQMAGVELRTVRERQYVPASDGPCLSVGQTTRFARQAQAARWEIAGDDDIVVAVRDGSAFLGGGRRRGALYAVYEFLETLGVRWYSPDYTHVPKLADIRMPAAPIVTRPGFWYRDQWWNNDATPAWLARVRINGSNGQNHSLPAELGGSAVTVHSCHSFKDLVPPEPNFTQHPDWLAVKENGKRGGKGELCLTNPALREFAAQAVLADLRKRGGAVDNYWVSQNDGGKSGCFCEPCTAERVAHGDKDRWSANIIGFVNHVADHVRAEFPKVWIKTLAYSYTQAAPEKLTVAPNVLVELCGNFRADEADPHRKLLRAWSEVAKNISVYTYGGSNYGYWWPYPNARELGMQCRWAQQNGVTAFYVQGTALGRGSGLVDLKAYLSARMAWDASRDVQQEIRDFCEGFYGPGGRFVVEYLNWYAEYRKQQKMEMDGGWGNAEKWRQWVTPEAMAHCDELFQQALKATQSEPVFRRHVRRAYLEVLWGRIMVDLKPKTSLADKELALVPGTDAAAVRRRAALFGEIMRENRHTMWSEIVPFDADKYPH